MTAECEAICVCEHRGKAEYCWDWLPDYHQRGKHHQLVCAAGARVRERITAEWPGYYRLHSLESAALPE